MNPQKKEQTRTFTPQEVKTIRTIKDQSIRSKRIAEVLQDIVDIFAAIRSQVAELDTPELKIRIAISVNPREQLIQLHLREEVIKVRNSLMRALSILTNTSEVRSQSMIFSRRGVSHRSIPPSTPNHPSSPEEPINDLTKAKADREECLRLLKHFYERLNSIAQNILAEN
jgi:hypothetical protein